MKRLSSWSLAAVAAVAAVAAASVAGCAPKVHVVPEYAKGRRVSQYTDTCRHAPPAPSGGAKESTIRVRSRLRPIDYCVLVDGQSVAVDPSPKAIEALASGQRVEYGYGSTNQTRQVQIFVAFPSKTHPDGSVTTTDTSQSFTISLHSGSKTCSEFDLDEIMNGTKQSDTNCAENLP